MLSRAGNPNHAPPFSLQSGIALQSIIAEAGWPIWPLIATSVFGLAIIIERFLSLRTARITPGELGTQVSQALRSNQVSAEFIEKLSSSSPLGQILADMLRNRLLGPDTIRQAAQDTGSTVAHELNRFLPALATVATVAPLMGLFGTVVGMIEIFAAYRPDGSDPSMLARGISVALYNTGFGILIAIPAMIAHRLFKTKIENLMVSMEKTARQIEHVIRAMN